MSWTDELIQPAWRGVEFQVLEIGDQAGRRIAIHEYPYRDGGYAEDLGRKYREHSLSGFVSIIDGRDPYDSMLAACDEAGPGTLMHPFRGPVQCALVEFSLKTSAGRGGICEFSGTWVETSEPTYPTGIRSSLDALEDAVTNFDASSIESFATSARNLAQQARNTVTAGINTVNGYVRTAQGYVRSAENAVKSVAAITGTNLGRFNIASRINGVTGIATAQQAIGRYNTALRNVDRLADATTRIGRLLG